MSTIEKLGKIAEAYLLEPLSRALISAIELIISSWERILIAAAIAVATGYYLYIIFITHHFFWDYQFYALVVKSMAAGASPYDHSYISEHFGNELSDFRFLYAPFVAALFLKLSWLFLTPFGLAIFIIIHAICWASIPYMLAGPPSNWHSRQFLVPFVLYLILFGLGGLKLLASGNISSILSALMLFSILTAVRKNDYKLFWVVILACSYIKIYFLAFLLFPVVLDKKYVESVVLVCALVVLFVIDYALHPQLFREFIATIAQQSDSGMVGLSLYSLLLRSFHLVLGPGLRGIGAIALAIHFVFVAIIVTLSYSAAARRRRPMQFDIYCCWMFMSACLISPRLLDYDIALLVVPVVVLGQMLLSMKGPGLAIAAVVAILGFVFMRTPLSDWSGIIAIVGIWLGSGVAWLGGQLPEGEGGDDSSSGTVFGGERGPRTALR